MMSVSLFPMLLLLSVRAALTEGVAAPLLTFTDTDPVSGAPLECDRCPPGTYLRARCTSTQKSDCAPCPAGSFTELWNYIGKCLRCSVCGQNQIVKTACAADSDCQCQCQRGYYHKKKYDMCLRHSECPPGRQVLTLGTDDKDTVCQVCPNNTYSNTFSAHENCTEHKSCAAAGLQLLLKGAAWHDSVCTSCDEHGSKDGADYLREILPSFFVHQKISIRRLRQIVQKLPSEGRRSHGATWQLTYSEVQERLNTWITSATAGQIRQLPALLTIKGATGAGEKLRSKLQRIDSHLIELCAGNEVEVVLQVDRAEVENTLL